MHADPNRQQDQTEGVPMKETRHLESEAQAIKAYETFIAALNAGNNQVMFEVMHVPHYVYLAKVLLSTIQKRNWNVNI